MEASCLLCSKRVACMDEGGGKGEKGPRGSGLLSGTTCLRCGP